jgi:hypothetical protein
LLSISSFFLHVLFPRAAFDVVVVEEDRHLIVAWVRQAVRYNVSNHVHRVVAMVTIGGKKIGLRSRGGHAA